MCGVNTTKQHVEELTNFDLEDDTNTSLVLAASVLDVEGALDRLRNRHFHVGEAVHSPQSQDGVTCTQSFQLDNTCMFFRHVTWRSDRRRGLQT